LKQGPRPIILCALLAMIAVFAASRAEAQQGDLWYDYGWIDYFYVQNCSVGIEGWISVDGRTVAHDFATGFEEVSLPLNASVHAKNQDQTTFYSGDHYFLVYLEDGGTQEYYAGSVGDSRTLPGAGPQSVNFKMSAFIARSWVRSPIDGSEGFGGDDRWSFDRNGETRIALNADIGNTATSDVDWIFGPDVAPGLSTKYDLPTSVVDGMWTNDDAPLTQAAKDDWVWGPWMKLEWAYSTNTDGSCDGPEHLGWEFGDWTSSERTYCWFTGGIPFVAFAPNIDMEATLTLTWGWNQVNYDFQGMVNSFPSYEGYLRGTQGDEQIFGRFESGGASGLWGPADVPFHQPGVVR
jgi:hypothetical protein